MARASFSVRLILSMHACRPALRQTSNAHVLDRYGNGSCSWCPVSDVEKMMMIAITFPRQHLFGSVSSPNYPVSVPVEDAYKLHKAGHKYLDVSGDSERLNKFVQQGDGAQALAVILSSWEALAIRPSTYGRQYSFKHSVLIDVTESSEFDEGHVSGAVNIPYLVSNDGSMSKNPKFLEEVASEFGRDDKIIVGCRSGKRSLMAVEDLRSAGYSKATNWWLPSLAGQGVNFDSSNIGLAQFLQTSSLDN